MSQPPAGTVVDCTRRNPAVHLTEGSLFAFCNLGHQGCCPGLAESQRGLLRLCVVCHHRPPPWCFPLVIHRRCSTLGCIPIKRCAKTVRERSSSLEPTADLTADQTLEVPQEMGRRGGGGSFWGCSAALSVAKPSLTPMCSILSV